MPAKNALGGGVRLLANWDGNRDSAYPLGNKPGGGGGGGSVSLGAHNSMWAQDGNVGNTDPATLTVAGTVAGSTRVVFSMGGLPRMATPTDNASNAYTVQGADQGYAGGQWVGYGMRVHTKVSAAGSGSWVVSVDKDNGFPLEEITLVGIEVIGGVSIVSSTGSTLTGGAGVAYASPSITVNGPALILAAWSGDGDTNVNPKDVTPSAGWTLLESAFISNTGYVQYAVAYRIVATAGTYSLNWTPTASQGASMKMLAVQAQ